MEATNGRRTDPASPATSRPETVARHQPESAALADHVATHRPALTERGNRRRCIWSQIAERRYALERTALRRRAMSRLLQFTARRSARPASGPAFLTHVDVAAPNRFDRGGLHVGSTRQPGELWRQLAREVARLPRERTPPAARQQGAARAERVDRLASKRSGSGRQLRGARLVGKAVLATSHHRRVRR